MTHIDNVYLNLILINKNFKFVLIKKKKYYNKLFKNTNLSHEFLWVLVAYVESALPLAVILTRIFSSFSYIYKNKMFLIYNKKTF